MMNEWLNQTVYFGLILSLAAYQTGVFLKNRFQWRILNPLLISAVLVLAFLLIFRIDYAVYYKGAQYISFLLTPATVCLAIPLHQQMLHLRKNVKAILLGILSGVLGSLISILVLSIVFRLSHTQYVTLLPKSITSAIGIGVAEELGGIPTITVATIIVTGIFGNIAADTVFSFFRIHDPIARGIALGTSSHAIGTARALEIGPLEGAMSSLAIVVAGLMTVGLAPAFGILL